MNTDPLAHLKLFVALQLLTLAGCGGGGGGSDGGGSVAPEPTENVSVTALSVNSPNPVIAYPVDTTVTVNATNTMDDVGVSLFAMKKTADDDERVEQIPIGNHRIAELSAGTSDHDISITIPSSIEDPGDYYIAALIDPADEISETDEEDNSVHIETVLIRPDETNIVLSHLSLDRAALLISTASYEEQVALAVNNVHNADAGGTITVSASGLDADQALDLEAFAYLRLNRADNGSSHQVPLYLWSTAQQRYLNAYGVDPETGAFTGVEWLSLAQYLPQLVEVEGDEVTLHDVRQDSTQLGFYFPGKLGKELEIGLRYGYGSGGGVFNNTPVLPPPDLTNAAISSLRNYLRGLPIAVSGDETSALAVMDFEVCVEIRPSDNAVVETRTDDNEQCQALVINLPPASTNPPVILPDGYLPVFDEPAIPQVSNEVFSTKAGGSMFSFGLEFGASAQADHLGYTETLYGAVPITIFGKPVDFYRISVAAQLIPDYVAKPEDEESGYTIETRFIGALIRRVEAGATSGPAVSLSFSKDYPDPDEGKKNPFEREFVVGIVPMIAGASVAANFGIEYQFVFESDPDGAPSLLNPDPHPVYELGNTLTPFINADVTLYAGVGNRLYSAGVEGVLTLLDERMIFFVGTQIDVIDDGYASGNSEFVIEQLLKLTNVFTGPQGAINLYAKYSVPKIVTCSWGFIKGKCIKTRTLKVTKNLYRSPALFKFEDVILDVPIAQLDVVVLPGEAPMYFEP